jgi:hypothetical protein
MGEDQDASLGRQESLGPRRMRLESPGLHGVRQEVPAPHEVGSPEAPPVRPDAVLWKPRLVGWSLASWARVRAWPRMARSILQGGECIWVEPHEPPLKVKNPDCQLDGRGGEGKNRLIKDHVSRDHVAICGEVKAAIAFMVIGISEEDTACRPRSKLVGCDG